MDCIVCKKDGTVKRVVTNAVRKGKRIEGDNGSITLTPELFDIVWTEQELTPVGGGYAETFADILTVDPPGFRNQSGVLPRAEKMTMLERLQDLAQYNFEQIDTYIENNVTSLSEAKTFLKQHAKVTLALIKLVQDKL